MSAFPFSLDGAGMVTRWGSLPPGALRYTGERWGDKQLLIVYYRVLGNAVRVDRILHKRMNPAKHL